MTHSTHLARHAGVAIAAALAIGTTPSLAEMAPDPMPAPAEPVLVIPQAPPPVAPPAPTIVLPTELPDENPVAQEATAPAAAAAAPTTRSAAAPPAPQRVTTPAAPVEPAAVAAPVAEESASLPLAESEPLVPFTAAETPIEDSASQPSGASTTALLAMLGALLALGLAIWGFVAIGRRKTVDRKAAAISGRPMMATSPAPPLDPIAAETMPVSASVAPTRIDRPTPAPSMAHSGAAVPLPRTMPATFEEREALIKRMVAARPDRANPFTAPLQRRRRARLILQSLGRDFGQAEPWIDLSQYSANWPELAGRRNAAA